MPSRQYTEVVNSTMQYFGEKYPHFLAEGCCCGLISAAGLSTEAGSSNWLSRKTSSVGKGVESRVGSRSRCPCDLLPNSSDYSRRRLAYLIHCIGSLFVCLPLHENGKMWIVPPELRMIKGSSIRARIKLSKTIMIELWTS
mmetsp:Transcript_76141/g.114639  ORF Transcript_76141/g.114639 Transcript_76141/m.114639 type:complete len:141 (-) Transcript_76141:37-459(-)